MSRSYLVIAAAFGVGAAIASARAAAPPPLPTPVRAVGAEPIVAELRDLPLPLEAFPRGIASRQALQRPLPALELRRQKIYDALHALGPASLPALATALRDPDADMRRAVAIALDVLGGGWWQFSDGAPRLDLRPVLPALLRALRDPDPDVRAWAARDIGDIGAPAAAAVPRLRAMLRSPEAGSRAGACGALGAIGPTARVALPDLKRALGDASPAVRAAARAAIAGITAPTSP